MFPQLAERRLRKELCELYRLRPRNCWAWPLSGDLMLWEASISGVRDTPYFMGIFMLRLKFNPSYPLIAPRVNFTTRIYHCNVDYDGYICWDLLSSRWSPIINVATILHAICALMRKPNVDDPCDEVMAALYRDNPDEYNSNAIDWTLKYAVVPNVPLSPIQTLTIEERDENLDDDDDDDGDENYEDEDETDTTNEMTDVSDLTEDSGETDIVDENEGFS
ncbi:ubiquitin-conjugating enzyme E2-16 kDa [Drosophila grimshawi]|uniref:GH17965 n=1 Tax=Drosophila grimshawi TaxID=7222 RepID=B4JXI7_DROGR|nr:ubiquitin-conjugating enzyme E2-16 kDa [Drosophila grimshawi]EDV95463.1 GH17965 [Drosophila grimshawi]